LVRQHTASNLAAQQRLVDKTLRRIAYHTLYRAMRIWKKEAEDRGVQAMQQKFKGRENALKLRLLTDKIALHRQSALRPVMQRWRRYTKERKERKHLLMDKVVRRMLGGKLWAALRQWKEWTQDAAVNQLRAEMNAKLHYQKQQRAAALIRTWRHRSIQPCFVAWAQFVRANQQRKATLGKVFARLTQLKLHQAFRTWRLWRAQQASSEALASRQRVIMDRTFRRLCATMLYRGFRTWVSYAEQHKQAQVSKSFRLLRSAAVHTKIAALVRNNVKESFLEWRRYARATRRERSMVNEMARFRQCDVLDRALRRVQHTSILRSFAHWRTYILRTRLMVNDKLGEYSEMILQLRAQGEHDALRLHEYLAENQQLKSNLLSIKHKQHTLALLSEKQREQRAMVFAYNSCLARNFRALYARVHFLRRRKLVLHKAVQHVHDTTALRTLERWRHQCLRVRSSLTQGALEAAKKQLDQCLGKVWSLEAQLAQRAAESDQAHAEAAQAVLDAQAAELNHQLEKQMPNEREQALAKEVDTLAAKLQLLLNEVKERGQHIAFLSTENQRLSTIVKSSASAMDLSAAAAAAGVAGAGNNSTLNLSTSSFARSARGPAATGVGAVGRGSMAPTSSFASPAPGPANASNIPPTAPRGGNFFPAGNVSFS
jgi:hypothetical protein